MITFNRSAIDCNLKTDVPSLMIKFVWDQYVIIATVL